jgi:hypothetical protein
MMKSLAINGIGFIGLGCITYGVVLWSVPAGFVVGGFLLVTSAVFAALPTRPPAK